jgi:RHS repeat-associated protein
MFLPFPMPRISGKERDAESGLDYFGARYMSSPQGRFTSPDPLLNSGRPWDPQSWNRYSYVLNNPLRLVDPNGLWDWAAQCGKGDDKCNQQREWFKKSLATLTDAWKKAKGGSPEYKALTRALAIFGTENDKNGIIVSFDKKGVAGGVTGSPSILTVVLDPDGIKEGVKAWQSAGYKVDFDIESAALVGHEGTHLADRKGGQSLVSWPERLEYERKGVATQSFVNELFNVQSTYNLWNPSWAAIDKEQNRLKAVEKEAERAARVGLTVKK